MLISTILFGCYDNQEACLDPEATNFDPEADKSCCCTYPQLKLDVVYQYDTLTFSENQSFEHDIHGQISVIDFGLIFHSFSLSDNIDTFPVTDTRSFWISEGTDSSMMMLTDDFILFGDRFNYTVGTFVPIGGFKQMIISTGLSDQQNRILPATLQNHPLATLDQRGYWDSLSGYEEAFIKLAYGTDLGDTTLWTSGTSGFDSNVELDVEVTKVLGRDLEIELEFDLKCWLGEIDFTRPKNEITEALLESFASNDCLKIRD
ncbi:MAG: hypothetical protein R3275_03140 [Saprospiraceae bacterium]|nr:hypothetical protein [Saprospiraceae bacterium]